MIILLQADYVDRLLITGNAVDPCEMLESVMNRIFAFSISNDFTWHGQRSKFPEKLGLKNEVINAIVSKMSICSLYNRSFSHIIQNKCYALQAKEPHLMSAKIIFLCRLITSRNDQKYAAQNAEN